MQYQFDYGNRLRDVADAEGGYAYDGYGRRVQQGNGAGTIDSFYDSTGALIYQQDRDGGWHDYLYLQGHLVAIRDYTTQGVATGLRYQHTDAQGSVLRQTDPNGAVIVGGGYIYDAFGKPLVGQGQDGPGYTGHVMDASTQLIYMQQRYYDPDAGRFLSMDPVDASGTDGSNLDRYWYAKDNPYRYTDPDGRCTGSNITNKDGSCASTGGNTTGTNGAAQGLEKSLQAAKQFAIGIGKAMVNTLGNALSYLKPPLQNGPTAFGGVPYDENAPLTPSNGIQAGGMIVGGIVANAGIAAVTDDPVVGEANVAMGARFAPVEATQAGEQFVRVGASPENLNWSFNSVGGVRPGTYAFPKATFDAIGPNPAALKNYGDLPGSAPSVYHVFSPPAGTPIQRSIVPGGEYGGVGGVPEVCFPEGC